MAGAPESAVTATDLNTHPWGGTWLTCADLTATLAGTLDGLAFTVDEGETKEIEFFTLTANDGFSLFESYEISATLAFASPDIDSSSGTGGGTFSTFFGKISGGTLYWDDQTLPDYLYDDYGNEIVVDFEEGWTITCGNTVTVHASITNNGGGTVPVPEPTTSFLVAMGAIAGAARLRYRRSTHHP